MIKDKLVADVRDEHIGELDNENNDDNIEWQLKKDGTPSRVFKKKGKII